MHQGTGDPTTRRQFLGRLGAVGTGALAASLGVDRLLVGPATAAYAAAAGSGGVPPSPLYFGQMFPGLAAFGPDTNATYNACMAVGAKGGIMDAGDDLAAGAQALIENPAYDGNPSSSSTYGTNPDNPFQTAGTGFYGQFIDHDISFDQTSLLAKPEDPTTAPNSRTPALDLDSVFGAGPLKSPHLYVYNSATGTYGPELLIGSGGRYEDLPRVQRSDGTYKAVLGDGRNDQTIPLAGLHCAHILFYNKVLANLHNMDLGYLPASMRNGINTPHGRYVAARQVTSLHYQWLVVNCHLPQVCGQAMVDEVVNNGNRFYLPPPGNAFVPIEFSSAAYRYGHSVIRPSYRANFTSGTGPSSAPASDPFYALTFDPALPHFNQPSDRDDLMGGYPASRRYIGWQSFFDAGDGQLHSDKRIDTRISSVMFDLPLPAIPPATQTSPVVLAQRTLLRHITWSLPSGQALAKAMGVPRLSTADLKSIASVYAPFATSTPLWYYLLAESQVMSAGATLGPTAGRIVAEVIVGLLRADPSSYLGGQYPSFAPTLGSDFTPGPHTNPSLPGAKDYTVAHFLHYAGVLDAGVYR